MNLLCLIFPYFKVTYFIVKYIDSPSTFMLFYGIYKKKVFCRDLLYYYQYGLWMGDI